MNPQLQWFNPGRRSWGISIANWSLPKTREWKNNNDYAPLADKCNGSERGSCTEKRGMEKKDSKWKMSHLTSSDRGSAEWEWDRTKKKMQEWAIKNKGTGVTIHLYVHSFMCICTYVSGQLSWVAFINQKKIKSTKLSHLTASGGFSLKRILAPSLSRFLATTSYHWLNSPGAAL